MDNFDKLLDVAHVLARMVEGENTPTEATSPPAEKPDISGRLKGNIINRIVALEQALVNSKINVKDDLKHRIECTKKCRAIAFNLAETLRGVSGFEDKYKKLNNLHREFNDLHMELKEQNSKG